MNRGNAHSDAGDIAEAVADYGRAAQIMEGIRSLLEPTGQWTPSLRNDLAGTYMNRGNAHTNAGDIAEAVADYGRAAQIMEGLRSLLEPTGQWTPSLRNDLAATYMNRGNAHLDVGDIAEAVLDYGRAAQIRKGIRNLLEPTGQWTPSLRNDLAGTYMNRGNAHSEAGNIAEAVADYGRAAQIMEGIQSLLEPTGQWTPPLRNALAGTYMNRGNAHSEAGNIAEAVADYGRAAQIMEGIRSLLEPTGQWTPSLRDSLATVYFNRGDKLLKLGDTVAARSDLVISIQIWQSAKSILEPLKSWTAEAERWLVRARRRLNELDSQA
jgi:tetratricopeptide (TPR) repeat protein